MNKLINKRLSDFSPHIRRKVLHLRACTKLALRLRNLRLGLNPREVCHSFV